MLCLTWDLIQVIDDVRFTMYCCVYVADKTQIPWQQLRGKNRQTTVIYVCKSDFLVNTSIQFSE